MSALPKKDKAICNCVCHTPPPGVKILSKHVIACCWPCPKCHKNIKLGHFGEHQKACKGLSPLASLTRLLKLRGTKPPEPQVEDDFR